MFFLSSFLSWSIASSSVAKRYFSFPVSRQYSRLSIFKPLIICSEQGSPVVDVLNCSFLSVDIEDVSG